jgi:hypothetical protein
VGKVLLEIIMVIELSWRACVAIVKMITPAITVTDRNNSIRPDFSFKAAGQAKPNRHRWYTNMARPPARITQTVGATAIRN